MRERRVPRRSERVVAPRDAQQRRDVRPSLVRDGQVATAAFRRRELRLEVRVQEPALGDDAVASPARDLVLAARDERVPRAYQLRDRDVARERLVQPEAQVPDALPQRPRGRVVARARARRRRRRRAVVVAVGRELVEALCELQVEVLQERRELAFPHPPRRERDREDALGRARGRLARADARSDVRSPPRDASCARDERSHRASKRRR
eukprot:30959-Pelagococcus_subviridis.AAC.10